MLGQTAEAKIKKFVDTMPTIIQTHLITCENWAKITKKVKELEHIIRKCDPLAAALPTLTQGAAVPSLYSHIAHLDDKEETDIPHPFKGVNQSKLKTEEEGKANSHSKNQTPLQYRYKRNNTLTKIPIITTTIKITEVNPEAIDPIETKILDDFSEVKIPVVEANITKIHTKVSTKVTIIKAITTKVLMVYTTTHIEAIIRVIIMANLEAEAMVMVEVITMPGLIIEVITTTNTISIMVMMMTTSLTNMVHHVHYVVAIITLQNTVLRENMILMT